MTNDNTPAAVYLLTVTTPLAVKQVLPFFREDRLKSHVLELIAKHGLVGLDERFKEKMILFLESKDVEKAITLYRRAQLENTTRLGLDFNWTGPIVVL